MRNGQGWMDWVQRRKYDVDKEKTANAIGPKRGTGRTTEGATEGMEGMAVGGKSCCPITVYGGARQTTRLCKVRRSCNFIHLLLLLLFFLLSPYLFIKLYYHRPSSCLLSSSREPLPQFRPELLDAAHFQYRDSPPLSMVVS